MVALRETTKSGFHRSRAKRRVNVMIQQRAKYSDGRVEQEAGTWHVILNSGCDELESGNGAARGPSGAGKDTGKADGLFDVHSCGVISMGNYKYCTYVLRLLRDRSRIARAQETPGRHSMGDGEPTAIDRRPSGIAGARNLSQQAASIRAALDSAEQVRLQYLLVLVWLHWMLGCV